MKVGLGKASERELQFPEACVLKAQGYLTRRLRKVWTASSEDMLCDYNTAINDLSMEKSPGYPYFYDCNTKLDALLKYGDSIRLKAENLLEGDDVPCFFSLTEKSELRQADKVDLGKNRVFMASDLHHLIASIILFKRQNDDLMDRRGETPSTIGIRLPGPEFVRSVLTLGDSVGDGDVSGCDLRYKLRVARVVRNVRASFLPERYRAAVYNLYDYVYAGACAGLGGIYRVYGNKSGWYNTGHDNTFMTWTCFLIACFHFFPDCDPEDVMVLLINGDDLLVNQKLGQFRTICEWLLRYNFVVDAASWLPRHPTEVVFLSHHIENRYVTGCGEFFCAAGNLDKILSSMNWIKKNAVLSFEESCVAHLLGLRLCLFPWAAEFEECDRLLSDYLRSIVHTRFISEVLFARLSERQLFILHTRVEGFPSFFPTPTFGAIQRCLSAAGFSCGGFLC